MLRIFIMTSLILFSWKSLAQTQEAYQAALADWRYVLQTYVDDEGRTDFHALSNDLEALDRVVTFIGNTSPASHPDLFPTPEAVMAYHINTYNALAMRGVIERKIPKGFTTLWARASFFKFRNVTIGGKKTNLYDYENKVIRPLDEPRSHFALNCMVKDCPRLPQEPFLVETLDKQLDAVSWDVFSKERHIYFDEKKKRVYVSAILDFYTKDFVKSGKAKDLPEYINQYLKKPIPEGYKVKFIDYDWRINQQPSDAG